jgi:hypothetical protein
MLYRLDLLDDQLTQSQHQCEAESDTALCQKDRIRKISIEDFGQILDLELVKDSQFGRTWPDHHPLAQIKEPERQGDARASIHYFTPTPTLRDRVAAIEADGRKVIEIQIREAF